MAGRKRTEVVSVDSLEVNDIVMPHRDGVQFGEDTGSAIWATVTSVSRVNGTVNFNYLRGGLVPGSISCPAETVIKRRLEI